MPRIFGREIPHWVVIVGVIVVAWLLFQNFAKPSSGSTTGTAYGHNVNDGGQPT